MAIFAWMGFKAFFGRQYAKIVRRVVDKWKYNASGSQQRILEDIVKKAANTTFGREHDFSSIKTYNDYKKAVPIRDYEQFKPYIDRVVAGEKDVLWPGKPVYLAKTSGTTSGVKYIPITKHSIGNHFYSAQTALMLYISETSNARFMDGKMIFLSGSPVLEKVNGIYTGRLSGIVNHHIPSYLKGSQVPSYKTNCIEDWETKVDAIVEETYNMDLRLISGIPPWVQMYFDRLLEKTGKQNIMEVFPNFSVFVYGGVNYEPYRAKLEATVGKKIDSVETFPASEGFIAYQDSQLDKGLLLNADSGIFYEFVPAEEIFNESPTRLLLEEVELGVNYALIINSNAGLWGYNIGDTVKFTSLNPYKLVVTGRVKHFISAFGEHVIGEEVERSILDVASEEGVEIVEFTVAPQVNTDNGLPYHEWFVEFANMPDNLVTFAARVDERMQQKNIYYRDLIKGKILQPLKIRPLQKGAFINYMRQQGKLGGQNKVPRLSNERVIADHLHQFVQN